MRLDKELVHIHQCCWTNLWKCHKIFQETIATHLPLKVCRHHLREYDCLIHANTTTYRIYNSDTEAAEMSAEQALIR